MRNLIARDIIPFGKILAKTDLRPVFKDVFSGDKKANNSEIILKLIYKILENMDIVGSALFEFLAYLENKEISDIEELPIDELVELIKQLFGDKNFGSFFKLASN
jgi:hypothetical protein